MAMNVNDEAFRDQRASEPGRQNPGLEGVRDEELLDALRAAIAEIREAAGVAVRIAEELASRIAGGPGPPDEGA